MKDKRQFNRIGTAGFVIALCSFICIGFKVVGLIAPLVGATLCFFGLILAQKRNLGIGLAISGLVIGLFLALIGGAVTVSDETPAAETNTPSIIETQPVQSDASVPTAEPTPPVEPTPTIDPAVAEAEYRESCQEIDYKDLCRYANDYYGANVVVEVRIQQTMDVGGWFSNQTAWYAMSDNSGYGFYYDDEYYLVDKRAEGAVKVLNDDIVRAYGTFKGLYTATKAITGEKVEIPRIEVKYTDLITE